MKNKKILIVYNTCGIQRDNTEWYIECLQSLLQQNSDDQKYRVLWSACLNSPSCFAKVYSVFKDKISYCYHSEKHTVNITFNKSVQAAAEHFGEFEGYVYVDSGCNFNDNKYLLSSLYQCYQTTTAEMIAVQSDTDEALQTIDPKFSYESGEVQIKGENYTIPVGKAINLHVQLFGRKIFENFQRKIIPDVFAAHCTESTFSFLTAAVHRKWTILKDVQATHLKGIDGASISQPHVSAHHGNTWNNLLYGRDARDFINDKKAVQCGLGYEECNSVMLHNPDAYDSNGYSKYPDDLKQCINKYFFLTPEELDYDRIKCRFVA